MGFRSNNSNRTQAPRIRVNQMIRVPEVFVIDETGTPRGNMTTGDALRLAEAAELDLVEVSPTANPPICKILDFGKYKYDQTKAKQRQKQNQKESLVKEIRLSVRISVHDLEVKAKRAEKFLNEGNKVKATVMFKGREMAHQELGSELLGKFIDRLQDVAKMEQAPLKQGRSMYTILMNK